MATKADGDEDQWKYRIFLVGFPDVVGCAESENPTVRVVDMIKHLVPEARVSEHPILREEPVDEQGSQGSEDEGMHSAASKKTKMSIKDVLVKGEKSDGSKLDISEAESAIQDAVETMVPPVAENENMIEDVASVISVPTHQFSPAWIEKEALALLGTIEQTGPTGKTVGQSKVLIAGYGFGGIVVKQAIIIANTTPRYYHLALNISRLVFFATPHQSNTRLAWEEILLNMIKETKISCPARLSYILSGLVDSVSQLSHVYYKFATKYPTTNFIEEDIGSGIDGPVVGKLGKFFNNLEKVVSWPVNDHTNLLLCAVNDLDKLELLRDQFTPPRVSNDEIPEYLNGPSQLVMNDTYLEALQTLSSSRWILYENRTLDKPDDFSDLQEIYPSLLESKVWNDVRENGSIQVTGPAGYGKSAFVKLISQVIRRRSSVVVLDNFLSSSERTPPTLYDVYVSSLHQIISQRPSLFRPVQNLMVEILRQTIWTEENLRVLLAAILHHSRTVDFLIVIYDFEDWPSEIRSWWSETLGSLMKSCVSAFAFLTSSRHPIKDLTSSKPHELDLEKEYERYKEHFIRAKTNNLLDHAYGSIVFGKGLSANVKKKIMSRAKSFQGSFSAIDTYLTLLFQDFTLNTLKAIMCNIEASPRTEEELYEREIRRLQDKPPIVQVWVSSAISWTLWSVRRLRIEELAAAVAVDLNDPSMAKVQAMVSMDMERDLRNHLGPVVAIENRYARLASASARAILSRDDTMKSLDLHSDSGLTTRCLSYITLILNDMKPGTWEKCLSQVSWKHQTLAPREPALEFLHYASRFWPTHFLLVKEPDSILKETVVEFLLAPEVGEKWFQLYLLCNSQSCDPLIGDQEADARQSAVRIASFVGLASIIPEILSSSASAKEPQKINVRRGYSERAILDTEFRDYLDYAISNDNDIVVKALLDSEPARIAKYFPLHKAVLAGCLKTAQILFNLLENPAQVDQDGRNPLHLAAIGGSTKMIRFLLGKNVSDAQARRTDIPNMIDIKDSNSQTPLIIASRMGNIEATRLLIGFGADLAIYDSAGKTALHYAVLNYPEAIGDFAAKDSAHIRDDDCTPLHTAAKYSTVETTCILVNALHASHRLATAINAQDDQKKTPLHYAAENGYTKVVEILLKYEASPEHRLATAINAQDDQKKTPLHYAAENGYTEVVEILLKYEASPEIQAAELAAARGHLATVKVFISAAKEQIGERLLKAASGAGQLLVVLYLLHYKLASPDGDKPLDSRPLSLAASNGHNEVVRTLLRKNAAVNIEDDARRTPLHHAAESGSYHVAQTLLNHQANVNAPDNKRNTPLHSAARAGRVEVVELLLKHGANVEAHSRTRETALHLSVKSPKAVKALLNAQADQNATDMSGQTPLHMATREKWRESAEHLLESGADISIQDDDGKPSLYYAINQNDLIMVKAFCENKVDFRDSEDQMHRALKWAVKSSALEVLEHLLASSPKSVNKTDVNGRTILHEAAEIGSLQILNLLLEAEATIDKQDDSLRTPLYVAAHCGRVDSVKRLLIEGADVKLVDNGGWSPLHAAADNLEITKILIAYGAEINLQNNDFWTPLHLAAEWFCTAVAKILLESGADPNKANSHGETALHLALGKNDHEMVAAMLSHGVDVNRLDGQGLTPLHTAIKSCEVEVVGLLLNKEVDLKIKPEDGLSCLSLAVDKDKHEMLEVLLSEGRSLAPGAVYDFEDMAAAYWKAIESDSTNSLKVLVNHESRLLDEVSNKGFTGLETCLRNRRESGKEQSVAIRFLELGVNPFKRRQADQESCFELGIIYRYALTLEFIDACLNSVPNDLSSATCDLGFKDLRIAAELDKPDLWKKLESLREAASMMTDHDGWSLDHFIHQSAGRMPARLKDKQALKPTRTPTGLVVPPTWLPSATDIEAQMDIAPSRLECSFASNASWTCTCLRADFPFPPRDQGTVYFEITISHTEPTTEPGSAPPIVTFGFCGEFCDLGQAHPGWILWSVGYQGDDGCIYEESRKYSTEHKFGPGNTVGCGIDYFNENFFFTLDGKLVASFSNKVIYRKLYPVIGHIDGACKVKVNFGEKDFVWQNIKKQKQEDIDRLKLQRNGTYQDDSQSREKNSSYKRLAKRFKDRSYAASWQDGVLGSTGKNKRLEHEDIALVQGLAGSH